MARNGPPSGTPATKSGGVFPSKRPPRTRKGRETRSQLLVAARTVFERDGFLGARITDMTKEAGLAYGGFYNYFDSKEEIFWAVLAEVRRDMLLHFAPREAGPTPTAAAQIRAIETSNAEFIESFRRNAAIIRVMEEVATFNDDFRRIRREARTRFIKRIERAVDRLQAANVADPELDPWCTANALGAMMDRFCYAWFVLGDPFDEDVAVATLNRIWFNALGISKARRPRPASVTPA